MRFEGNTSLNDLNDYIIKLEQENERIKQRLADSESLNTELQIIVDDLEKESRLPEGYVIVPTRITNRMKAKYMGEFSWLEESDQYNEFGEVIEYTARHTVPWDLCKDIYKAMIKVAQD